MSASSGRPQERRRRPLSGPPSTSLTNDNAIVAHPPRCCDDLTTMDLRYCLRRGLSCRPDWCARRHLDELRASDELHAAALTVVADHLEDFADGWVSTQLRDLRDLLETAVADGWIG